MGRHHRPTPNAGFAGAWRRVRDTLTARPKLLAGVGVPVLLLTLFFGWLGVALLGTYLGLAGARDHAETAKSALLSGDTATARTEIDAATAAAATAHETSTSAPLSWVAAVPGVGSPVRTVQGVSDIIHRVMAEVLTPAANSDGLSMLNPKGSGGHHIDLAALTTSLPQLQQSAAAAAAVDEAAAHIPQSAYLGVVNDARAAVIEETGTLSNLLGNASKAAEIVPSMLGANGPRNYLMVFQTNAEARGTGGLMGGSAILEANGGSIGLAKAASNLDLGLDYKPIDLGPEFNAMYGRFKSTSNWQNANFSPHFPYAAEIWRSIWAQQNGLAVDGVIATDPEALSYILGAVGPVTLANGDVIDSSNVVSITENEAYFRFGDDQLGRKAYLQEISKAVIDKVNSADGSMKDLLQAIGRAVGEGRLLVWSAHPEEQKILADSPLGGIVPTDTAPFANVIVNNGAGGKLDYYLKRDISYTADGCAGPTRQSTVAATLTNTAPTRDDYPSYLYGRRTPETAYDGPPGTNRSVVTLFATQGATLRKATVNGKAAPIVLTNVERGHPTFTVVVITKPGDSADIVFDLTEPTAPGAPRVPVQPLVLPATVHVDVPTCD